MAEEPDIIYSDTPSVVNLSFGKNVFSFYDQNETGQKGAIKVYDSSNNLIGTFESYPNNLGYYYYDLQNLVKNYTTPNYAAEAYTTKLTTANDESFEFYVQYGWVSSTGTFNLQGRYPVSESEYCIVYGGRKEYWDLRWDSQPDYIMNLAGIGGCPIVSSRQQALTDWTITKEISKLTGGVPSWIPVTITEVYNMEKRLDDELILSFLTKAEKNIGLPPPLGSDGVKGIRVTFYNDNTEIYDNIIPNDIVNGGGSTNDLNTNRNWNYPYNAISIGLGKKNFNTQYLSAPTHLYVATYTYKGVGTCSAQQTDFSSQPTSEVYRIDIVNDECNDFAPVQVSWLNSLGFRDYFYFSKRTDERINITRNNFEKVEGTWGSDRFEVPTYDRGSTTFSQDLTKVRTINTRFLSDAEAQYLKNLYISPDVRVRYDGDTSWIPVTLTDGNWTEKTFRKDKFFQYTLNYVEAHKINSQRG